MARDQTPARWGLTPPRSHLLGPFLLALVAPVAASGCDDEEAPIAELDGYEVRVPEGWTASPSVDGPRRILTLRDGDRAVFCQIVVLRDGRVFHEDDAQAFVGDGKAAFEVAAERPATLDTPEGPLLGFATREADLPSSWILSTLAGEPMLEMYAGSRGRRLVAAIAATFSGVPGAEDRLGRCREAIATMAVP